jgi:hypothetical protein
MIIEYTIENIKEYYLNNDILEDINNIENIISNDIDNNNINSEILHIFPITFSLSITLLLASYILLH